jgi:hypothetical protein
MDLYNKILLIYPELASEDFASSKLGIRLKNDGEGDYIAKWEHPTLAQPTQEQLDAVEAP